MRAAAQRVAAIRALGLLAFLALAARAAHLTMIEEQGHELGRRQVHTHLELPPARGAIYDRRGVELAVTTQSPSVYAIGREIDAAGRRALARALQTTSAAVDARLADRRGFTFIARWVDADAAERVARLGLAGVGLVSEPRRAYPAGALAGHLLGFADIDGEGVRGIEQLEDRWLSGTRLVVPVERDGGGQLLARSPLRPADAAGGDVALTLDASLQAEAESALQRAIEASGARGGVVVTLDPETSDVLALAEAPAFDPNAFRTTPYADSASSAFLVAREPGSTLKVFLAAAALDERVVRPGEPLATAGGSLQIPGKTIRDHRDYGPLDLAGMLRVSSNVGAVLVGRSLGRERHYRALRRFGFGQPTGSRFPSESAGLLRPWQQWRPLDHATISFGQGINVTPVQLATATAALAHDGEWRTPRLVLARRLAGRDWDYSEPAPPRRVVSRAAARATLAMMREVVGPGGTGRRADLAGLAVAGKTGTAQKLDEHTRRYASDRYVAWFIGVVPADAPRLVIVVALDEPERVHTGGLVAAPLFARVAAAQLAHLGIITRPQTIGAAPAVPMLAEAEPAPAPRAALEIARIGDRIMVPDFHGHLLAEVRQITAAHALALHASGSGRAVSQDPAPGTILSADERDVRVHFEAGDGPVAPARREAGRSSGARLAAATGGRG